MGCGETGSNLPQPFSNDSNKSLREQRLTLVKLNSADINQSNIKSNDFIISQDIKVVEKVSEGITKYKVINPRDSLKVKLHLVVADTESTTSTNKVTTNTKGTAKFNSFIKPRYKVMKTLCLLDEGSTFCIIRPEIGELLDPINPLSRHLTGPDQEVKKSVLRTLGGDIDLQDWRNMRILKPNGQVISIPPL